MEIAKMSAAQLTKAMEKASTESSKITQMLIDAGRGNEYPSDMMKKSDPLSLKYQKSASLLQDLYAEKSRRITYSGTMRPIKYQENPTMATKKFSPAQIAAQKLFAERARAGTLGQRKKRKPNPGLYENINAKRKRIAAGSGERMRKPGSKGAPTQEAFEQSAMTAKRNPITETLIYGLAPGETRDYMEELMYAGGLKLTPAEIDKVLKAAGDAGYHSFRIAGFDPTMKPDFAKAVKRNLSKSQIAAASKVMAKRNPDKSKPRAYVKRASQATGAPPSKRLVSRRKMALKAPAGYFPNPMSERENDQLSMMLSGIMMAQAYNEIATSKKLTTLMLDWVKSPSKRDEIYKKSLEVAGSTGTSYLENPTKQKTNSTAMMTGYQVICMHPKKHVVGIFKTMAEAKMVATAMADAKGVPYGVKAVKVHKTHFAV